MKGATHQISHATWRLRIFRQIYAPIPRPQPLNRQFSISSSQLNEDHNEALSKTPPTPNNPTRDLTPPSQRLPQSPVITHPRSGIKKARKARAEYEDNVDLKKNPWAVALASPVRMCASTGTRLPRRLMGVYGLVKRPDTHQSYMLPLDLLKDSIQKRSAEGESSTPEPDASARTDEVPGGNVSPLIARDRLSSSRPALHMLTLRPLIRALTPILATKVGKRPGIAKLIPYRWKVPIGPLNSTDLKDCVWKSDMPDYILRHMRKDLVKRLVKAHEDLEADHDIAWKSLDIDEYSDSAIQTSLEHLEPLANESCGAVLLVGSEEHATEQRTTSKTILHPRTKTNIPIFDLTVLLSENELDMLRKTSSGHLQSKAIFFRPNGGRDDTNLMLYLWKTQRFLDENLNL